MTINAYILSPDGTVTTIELTGKPSLDQMQEWVGGDLIQIVPYFQTYQGEPCIAFCAENGKINKLPVNVQAHQAWEAAVGTFIRDDHLVGPVLILQGDRSFLASL